MAPKFWMELSCLTMTFLVDMAMAPLDRHTVTIMGSISGVRPTATAMAKRKACCQSCLVKPLMKKTRGTMTAMKRIISQVKLLMPRSKLVGAAWPTMALDMLPRKVRRPVTTITPWAEPLSTLVPRKQMFFSSKGESLEFSSRASNFSTG